jgi:hypothetical protein
MNRLFAYDRAVDDVIALAYSDAGGPANGFPSWFGISGQGVLDADVSADARFVALSTTAWNLSPGDGNAVSDVFVIDRTAAPLDLAISRAGESAEVGCGLLGAELPQILNWRMSTEPGGRFQVRVINRGETNREARVWIELASSGAVVDWPAGWTAEPDGARRLPELAPGESGVFGVCLPTPSADSMARLRVAVGIRGTTGALAVLDRVTALITTDLNAPGIELASWTADGAPSPSHVLDPSVDSSGQRIVFDAVTDSLVATDKNDRNDVFVRDRALATTRVLSVSRSGAAGTDWSIQARISTDGRLVSFSSWANNLGPDANYICDVFVKNLENGAVELASRRGSIYGNYGSGSAALCDGKHVVFQSYATNLVVGDTNRQGDIFLLDRTSTNLSLISRSATGAPGNGASESPSMSASGRFVAFSSLADNLGSYPDTNSFHDAFLWDATSKTPELLTVGRSGSAALGQSLVTGISDDGRYVSLISDAPDLPGGLTDGRPHFYLLDRFDQVFYPAENWLPPDSPGQAVAHFTVGDDGEWLLFGLRREAGTGHERRFETRIELVHRPTGRRQVVAAGSRGPGAPADGFSEVNISRQGLLGLRRFLAFLGEGREGRAFISQAYLFDRTQPSIQVQAGRSQDHLRLFTDSETNSILREINVLVTPGAPSEFCLLLRNASDFPDTLQLQATHLGPEWQLELHSGPDTSPLALPFSFFNLASQAQVTLSGRLTLTTGVALPTPVELALGSTANRSVMEHIRIKPLLDSDADQIADAWEFQYFGNLTVAAAGTDADSDGQTDRDEFLTGTHPTACLPPLALNAVALLPDGRLRLEWPAVADRFYVVERSAALDLPFAPRSEALPGRAGVIEFLDTLEPGTSASFYRILADLP